MRSISARATTLRKAIRRHGRRKTRIWRKHKSKHRSNIQLGKRHGVGALAAWHGGSATSINKYHVSRRLPHRSPHELTADTSFLLPHVPRVTRASKPFLLHLRGTLFARRHSGAWRRRIAAAAQHGHVAALRHARCAHAQYRALIGAAATLL